MMCVKKSALCVLVAGAIVLSLASCKGKAPGAAAKADEEPEIVFAVSTYKTGTGKLDDYLEFGGDVASVNAIDVLPDMAGKISRVTVSLGDTVRKDQVIAYVDASRAGMYYSASPVKAPISGRVTSLPATVGATVSQSTSIAKVSRTDDLEVKISVAERFISRISDKQAAAVSFDAYPSVEFDAKVFEISPVLDTTTRTMLVKLRFAKPDNRIKVGMYGRVKLVTDSVKNAIVIPNGAIVKKDGKNYVFVISSQKSGDTPATVRMQPVTLGISVDNKTEVTNGLSAGDEIVIKGLSLLTDGAKVNIFSVQQAE